MKLKTTTWTRYVYTFCTESVLGKPNWRDGSKSRTCIFGSYPFLGKNYVHALSLGR